MDERAETIQLQNQVRQNAEEYRNTVNELCNWAKEIKEKEKNIMNSAPYDKNLRTIPVRGVDMAKAVQTLPEEKQLLLDSNKEAESVIEQPLLIGHTSHDEANKIKEMGNGHVKRGEYELALEAYTAAIQIYDEDVLYYCNRALCYLKLERYEECIKECNHALSMDNLAVKAIYRRMQAYEGLGNHLSAYHDCKLLLKIDPNNKEAKHALARINARLTKTSSNGPKFTKAEGDWVEVETLYKPPCKRSVKPLVNVKVESILGDRERMEIATRNLDIPDDDVDKIFNSNCGPYVEVKKPIITNESDKKVAAPAATPPKIKDVQQPELKQKITKVPEIKKVEIRDMPIPNNPIEFYSAWRDLNMEDKYNYLTRIDINKLNKVLGAGFDSDTLTEILQIIRDYYLPNKHQHTLALIKTLLEHQQMPIISMFLSRADKSALESIFEELEKQSDVSKDELSRFKKTFGYNV